MYDIPDNHMSIPDASEAILPLAFQMVENSIYSQNIFEENEWQPANHKNLEIVLDIINKVVRKNSKILHGENLQKVQALIDSGKSCIMMPEHYSNFDLPVFFFLVKNKHPEYFPVMENIISLSAAKLNAESKIVLAFSEAFNRIMIYPARSKNISENMTEKEITEQKYLDGLNQRAIKQLLKARDNKKIILMFPSGTRYRPENPESRKALPQAASFLRRFDYVCFVGISGNALVINPSNKMAEDIVREDSMVYLIDEPRKSKEFLAEVNSSNKEEVSQHITQHLLDLHAIVEKEREPLVRETPPKYLGPMIEKETLLRFAKSHNIDVKELMHKILS